MKPFENLREVVLYAWDAHQEFPLKPKNATRLFDAATPYIVHPVAAAFLFGLEPLLPINVRREGVEALLLHDVLEDTDMDLPQETSNHVRALVEGLTFPHGSMQKMAEIWDRPFLVQLLELYDLATNAMDGQFGWMAAREKREPGYRARALGFMKKLSAHVEEALPSLIPGYSSKEARLNIFRIIEMF